MAHFAVLCPEAGGHLFPVGSLGVELRERGHQVTVVGRGRAKPIVEQLGLPLHELPAATDSFFRLPPFPVRYGLRLLGVWRHLTMRYSFCWRTAYYFELMPEVLKEVGAEALLADQGMLAARTVAERLGLPHVTVCSAMHWLREPTVPPAYTGWLPAGNRREVWRNRAAYAVWDWYVRPAMKLIGRRRRQWGLAPQGGIDGGYSPLAIIAQTCPEFDFPRAGLPDTFHYVGALATSRPCDVSAFPWERLDGRPLIYASLGTVSFNQRPGVFRSIAEACCGLNAQLVVSAGRWEEDDHRDMPGAAGLPGDPLVLPFVPQLALLEKARLFVTHAGQNGLVEALTRAVPMVALPQGADQFALAARIEAAGVGLRVKRRDQCTPGVVRDAVERVFREESFQRRAEELRQAMLAAGGVKRAADIAEQACETGKPVRRAIPGR